MLAGGVLTDNVTGITSVTAEGELFLENHVKPIASVLQMESTGVRAFYAAALREKSAHATSK